MVVCNLIREPKKRTGNFIVFSQYTDDITKSVIDPVNYKVEPKKFMAFDINFGQLNEYRPLTNKDANYTNNQSAQFAAMLQNEFENGCAYIKNNLSGSEWKPEYATQLLFSKLEEYNLLHWISDSSDQNAPARTYLQELMFMGDIQIQSYEEIDGQGYAETYCYLSNSDAKHKYFINLLSSQGQSEMRSEGSGSEYIQGWTELELESGNSESGSDNTDGIDRRTLGFLPGYTGSDGQTFIYDNFCDLNSFDDSVSENSEIQPDDKFKVTMIIVLYDITEQVGDETIIHKNIPYGIYLPGLISSDEYHYMSNYITKYVENDDTFGEGTSYGLRISSKYIAGPTTDLKRSLTYKGTSTENYTAYSQVMSQMAESQAKMDEIIESFYDFSRDIKDHLATFKDYRTNVPYTKDVDEEQHWFVNGRDLGRINVGRVSAGINSFGETENGELIGGDNPADIKLSKEDGVDNFAGWGEISFEIKTDMQDNETEPTYTLCGYFNQNEFVKDGNYKHVDVVSNPDAAGWSLADIAGDDTSLTDISFGYVEQDSGTGDNSSNTTTVRYTAPVVNIRKAINNVNQRIGDFDGVKDELGHKDGDPEGELCDNAVEVINNIIDKSSIMEEITPDDEKTIKTLHTYFIKDTVTGTDSANITLKSENEEGNILVHIPVAEGSDSKKRKKYSITINGGALGADNDIWLPGLYSITWNTSSVAAHLIAPCLNVGESLDLSSDPDEHERMLLLDYDTISGTIGIKAQLVPSHPLKVTDSGNNIESALAEAGISTSGQSWSMVVGQYNKAGNNIKFAVGVGTSNARRNAFSVEDDGTSSTAYVGSERVVTSENIQHIVSLSANTYNILGSAGGPGYEDHTLYIILDANGVDSGATTGTTGEQTI